MGLAHDPFAFAAMGGPLSAHGIRINSHPERRADPFL